MSARGAVRLSGVAPCFVPNHGHAASILHATAALIADPGLRAALANTGCAWVATKQQEAVHTLQENARLLGDLSRAQGDLHQAQEEVRGLRPLKDELGFAQRRSEELGRRLVEQDAAVQQLSTSKEQLQAKVDELLSAKQQLELALATARSSVTAQEQVVASMLERFSTPATGPNLVANPVEEAGRPWKRESKKSTGTGT